MVEMYVLKSDYVFGSYKPTHAFSACIYNIIFIIYRNIRLIWPNRYEYYNKHKISRSCELVAAWFFFLQISTLENSLYNKHYSIGFKKKKKINNCIRIRKQKMNETTKSFRVTAGGVHENRLGAFHTFKPARCDEGARILYN